MQDIPEAPDARGQSRQEAISSILLPWLAFQNQSILAAEALVECVVNLYRAGWTVQQVQLELAFLSLQRVVKGMEQVQDLDSDMLLSFVVLICITCEVCSSESNQLHWHCVLGSLWTDSMLYSLASVDGFPTCFLITEHKCRAIKK